jgi:hypothetical protein
VVFKELRVEDLFKPYAKGQAIKRYHYLVKVTNGKDWDELPFFCPRIGKTDQRNGRWTTTEPLKEFEQNRLIGFISCLMSDVSYREAEGIDDALDYMEAHGCTPDEARLQYAKLREAEHKIKRVFDYGERVSLSEIVEGY